MFNTAGLLAPNNAIQVQPCYKSLVVNHYYTRSRQDWLAKLQRADAAAGPTERQDDLELFDRLASVCQVRDATILSFASAVRASLGLEATPSPPIEAVSEGPVVAVVAAKTVAPEVTASDTVAQETAALAPAISPTEPLETVALAASEPVAGRIHAAGSISIDRSDADAKRDGSTQYGTQPQNRSAAAGRAGA